MARKKKKNNYFPKLSPPIMLFGALVILILGMFGIQTPEFISDYFNSPQSQPTEQQAPAKKNSTNPGPQDNGLAVFTEDELKDAKQGWITYHELDGLGRATGADALIKQKMINTGTSANRNIRPPGFISGLEPYFHSRGHLIGRQFGGSGDDERNLVTLYQNPVNTPYMTEYENRIRRAVDAGETVRYRVTPVYNDKDLMPAEVHLEAQGITAGTQVNFNVTIINEP